MGRYFGLYCSYLLTTFGRTLCGVILGFVVCAPDVSAMTYYLSPTGSDSDSGISLSSPWKTFNFAADNLRPGDTLALLDGRYTATDSGSLNVSSLHGTATAPITIKAMNERKAWLSGKGSDEVVLITNSSYIVLEGLHISSADLAGVGNVANVRVETSNNVTLRRLIVDHSNRYVNVPLIQVTKSPNNLFEELELYYYHRHGLKLTSSGTNVVRRIYCNSRGYDDIAGGYPSGYTTRGDACVTLYPASNTIVENVISEGQGAGFDIEALGTTINNKLYGNISLNDNFGYLFKARGTTSDLQPQATLIVHGVAITSISAGFLFRGNLNTTCNNCTVLDSRNAGIAADHESAYQPSQMSVFGNNSLAVLNLSGFSISAQTSWSFTNVNAYTNSLSYLPALPSTGFVNSTTTDPQLGTCRVWIPDNSPMKRAGKDGADIGANILYRYKNGVLTKMPLWNLTTGEFPHGAIVAGLNDVAGQSAFDVHKRLNVNTNGCVFPASYAQGSDSTSPATPTNLQVQ